MLRQRTVSWRGRNRNGHRFDFHLPVYRAHVVSNQRFRRWPGRDCSILVINAAVTWTHEQVCIGQPAHRTAQMRTVDRKRNKFALGHPAQPQRALRRNSRPWKRRRIDNINLDRVSNWKIGDFANGNPKASCLAKNRPDNKTNERNAENARAQTGESDAHLFQKTPASNFLWRKRPLRYWMISGDFVHGEFRRSILQATQ